MLDRAVRPLPRIALLSVLVGAVPPAPLPLARATADRLAAVAGPPAAASTPAAAPGAPSAAPDSTPVPHPEPPPPSLPAHAPITPASPLAIGNLPLSFVANAGQLDNRVRYTTRGLGGTVFFTPQEVVLAVPTSPRPERPHAHLSKPGVGITNTQTISMSIVRQRYEGAGATPSIVPTNRLVGTANYLLGADTTKWRTNLPTYAGIIYQQLYPGIDLGYDGTDGQLKSTFTVTAGADPSRIRWHYQGAREVQVDAKTGNLLIILAPPGRLGATQTYTLTEQAPVAWQTINGQRVPVSVQYTVGAGGRVSFALGAYDTAQPLTIDPTLTYSTYLGGVYGDDEDGIAVDSAGNMYVTGASYSTNFPTTAGALDTTYDASGDLYVAKLQADGSAWAYSTFVGGSDYEVGVAIAVDSAGNAYVTGETQSTNFPTTVGAYDRTCGTDGSCNPNSNNNPRRDGFVIKLNTTGSALSYGTLYTETHLPAHTARLAAVA